MVMILMLMLLILFFSSVFCVTASLSTICNTLFLPIENHDHSNILLSRIKFKNSKFAYQKSIYIRGGGVQPLHLAPIINDFLHLQPIVRDSLLTGVIVSETVLWLKIWTTLAKNDILPSTLTRKIIHSGSVPLFLIHWPLYSMSPFAKFFAASIPLLQILSWFIICLSPLLVVSFH
mmetsp:Transcript_32166/g.46377  ORF Transcript_32166/g.46377 Transcript_32166/m.46377 type:complete len:176 (-) Transcript_32166:1037-1564(-)